MTINKFIEKLIAIPENEGSKVIKVNTWTKTGKLKASSTVVMKIYTDSDYCILDVRLTK